MSHGWCVVRLDMEQGNCYHMVTGSQWLLGVQRTIRKAVGLCMALHELAELVEIFLTKKVKVIDDTSSQKMRNIGLLVWHYFRDGVAMRMDVLVVRTISDTLAAQFCISQHADCALLFNTSICSREAQGVFVGVRLHEYTDWALRGVCAQACVRRASTSEGDEYSLLMHPHQLKCGDAEERGHKHPTHGPRDHMIRAGIDFVGRDLNAGAWHHKGNNPIRSVFHNTAVPLLAEDGTLVWGLGASSGE